MNREAQIGVRRIGGDAPCYVIAEVGVNHNGDMSLARRLTDEAVAAGVDAVKFQTYVTEELVVADAPKTDYQVETTGEATSQFEMLKQLELSASDHAELKKYCEEKGVDYLCTPYDLHSVRALHEMGIAAFKIASTDTTNIPFLKQVAARGRPVILSTGLSTLGEVEAAVGAMRRIDPHLDIILLQAVAAYPTPIEEVNLRAMATLRMAFDCPVGFSDHTVGVGASPWAVACGAAVIEKHFTLDHDMQGPDHRSSLDPSQLRELVRQIRTLEAAMGDGVKRLMPCEKSNKTRMQKSLVLKRPVSRGETIEAADLTCKRPASGLLPAWLDRVAGRRAVCDIPADVPVRMEYIDWRDA